MKTDRIIGLIILACGIIFLGNALNIFDVDIFFDGWWTLFIIIPSLGGYAKKQWVSSTISLSLGIFLLLSANDIVDWSIVPPVVLIIIGLSLILKPRYNNIKVDKYEYNKGSKNEYTAIFSGNENMISDEIEDMSITVLFGGIDLDMRKAKLNKDVRIDCTCIFGGVDILVPNDVNVVTEGTTILGGVENKVGKNKGNTITLSSTCAFGGIDIK